MITIMTYLNFIKEKGKSIGEINPGSDAYALEVDDALQAIEILKEIHIPVLGGDILSNKSGSLIYAYQFWGSQYHCLNWYCEKSDSESKEVFCERSIHKAKKAIELANMTAKKLGKKCYINLIV